jgi:hypothetical protein
MIKLIIPAALIAALLAGCGESSTPPTPERAGTKTAGTTPKETPEPARHEPRADTRHEKRAAKVKAAPTPAPNPPAFVACDRNIKVRAATTTCELAQSSFYEYSQDPANVSAYSPSAGEWYRMECYVSSAVVCKGSDGGEVHFPESAIAAYTYDNAVAYASSHKVNTRPDGEESYADDEAYSPDEDDSTDDESYGDDYPGYDDGDDYTEPGENIPYYDEGDGYRVQCSDGTYSHSGGIQGACSHHGGIG